MITIIYSGTITEERLDNDRENLETEIIEAIKESMSNSAFWVGTFVLAPSDYLTDNKMNFSVPIQLIKNDVDNHSEDTDEQPEHKSDI